MIQPLPLTKKSEMKLHFNLFVALVLCLSIGASYGDPMFSACDADWYPYEDKSCIKIIDQIAKHSEAETICKEEGKASLLVIKSQEEQDHISTYLFHRMKVMDSVWLAGQRNDNVTELINSTFIWSADDPMAFEAWAENRPTEANGNKCMQMRLMYAVPATANEVAANGQWTDVPCRKRNLVVCQKMQIWSFAKLQDTVVRTMNQLQTLQRQTAINEAKRKDVPVGFVYFELPGQAPPQELWPTLLWKDVSRVYAGSFFRVFGGQSEDFGVLQKESSPRLVSVQTTTKNSGTCTSDCSIEANDEFSQNVYIPHYNGQTFRALQFKVSGGGVVPQNHAIRVWMRVDNNDLKLISDNVHPEVREHFRQP